VNKNLEYIDLLIGLAILLVVAVHASKIIWSIPTEYQSKFFDLSFAFIFNAGQNC
jgi:hypothetical protein